MPVTLLHLASTVATLVVLEAATETEMEMEAEMEISPAQILLCQVALAQAFPHQE